MHGPLNVKSKRFCRYVEKIPERPVTKCPWMRFEIPTFVSVNTTVFKGVTPCSLVAVFQTAWRHILEDLGISKV